MPKGLPHSEFLAWDEDDQDKALEYMRQQRTVCEGCGTREETWQRDPFAYVGWIDRCKGCEVIKQEEDNVPAGQEKGVKISLVPREWALAQMEQGNSGS